MGAPGRIVLPAEVLPVDLAPTFAIGQRLQGEVVRIVPHGGVLVNFDGQPVLLALAQQVVPGQILTATVAQISPALLLQLTDELPRSLPAETTLTLAPVPQEGHQEVLTAAQLKAYLMANQPFGETVTTTVRHQPAKGGTDCLTWGAVVFSTAVADVDNDGHADIVVGSDRRCLHRAHCLRMLPSSRTRWTDRASTMRVKSSVYSWELSPVPSQPWPRTSKDSF